MKLATSTGDFGWYVDSLADKVKNFKETKFRYINLEQPASPLYFSGNISELQRYADELGNAAAYAGVEYVVSHAPCLNVYKELDDETYNANLRAIRNSIEVCALLGIKRIVVHACFHTSFTPNEYYKRNKQFYSELFDLMEKHEITVMTENVDNFRHPVSTGKEMRELVDCIDHPLFAVCWDTAHGNINLKAREEGQYKNITDIGDKLKGLHISDNFGDTHHHSWPFAGIINFDSVMQGLVDVNYDGYFTFEASYTLLHHKNLPYQRKEWEHNGETVTKLLDPSAELKRRAVELLYETGKYILEAYDCYEE